jgi:translation initiation factor IF-3
MLAPPVKSGPRFDDMIQSDKVRVIDENGENLGVMYTSEAIEQANEIGKHRYEAQKKANAARKTQKTQQIKEIKMRPNIDIHDYDVKMRSVRKFIEEGDKVKMTLRFRGREMAHQELGMDVLKRVQEDMAELAKVEAYPRLEGRQMLMVLAPK